MKPILSIVIPAYNVENTIERCIESIVCDYTHEKIEIIIIIDDGSIDETGCICDKYEELYNYIHVIHKNNEGQGIARNLGIEKSNGTYITFIDSDDYIKKEAIDKILNDLEKEHYDLVIYNWKKICNIEKNTDNISYEYEANINNYNEIFSLFSKKNKNLNIGSGVWNKFYRLDTILQNNIRFTSERKVFSEDFLFNITYSKYISNFKCSPIKYYNYLVNDSSYCHTYQKNYLHRVKQMYNCIINEDIFELLDLENKNELNKRFFDYIKSCIIQEFMYNKSESNKNVRIILEDRFCMNIIKDIKYSNIKRYSERFVFFLMRYKMISMLKFLYLHKNMN